MNNEALGDTIILREDEINSEFYYMQWYLGFMTRQENLRCLIPEFPAPKTPIVDPPTDNPPDKEPPPVDEPKRNDS